MEITIDPATRRICHLDKKTKKEITEWVIAYQKTGKQSPPVTICSWYNIWANKCENGSLEEFVRRFSDYSLMMDETPIIH